MNSLEIVEYINKNSIDIRSIDKNATPWWAGGYNFAIYNNCFENIVKKLTKSHEFFEKIKNYIYLAAPKQCEDESLFYVGLIRKFETKEFDWVSVDTFLVDVNLDFYYRHTDDIVEIIGF